MKKQWNFAVLSHLKHSSAPTKQGCLLIVARFVVVSKKEGFLRRQKGKQNERCSIEADVCRWILQPLLRNDAAVLAAAVVKMALTREFMELLMRMNR